MCIDDSASRSLSERDESFVEPGSDPELESKSSDVGSLIVQHYETYSAAQLGISSYDFPHSMRVLHVEDGVYSIAIIGKLILSL